MRYFLAAPVLALASGCVTNDLNFGGIGGGARNVNVVTDPPGALLTVEGAGECETLASSAWTDRKGQGSPKRASSP